MIIEGHRDMRIEKRTFGDDGTPLLVIDNLAADPEQLVRRAARRDFTRMGEHFPGARTGTPATYGPFLESVLNPLLPEHFGLRPGRFRFSMCHYSLVATPPEQLRFLQRVPHIDSVGGDGLATVHYLFRGHWGGTAFYRHRGTGFEHVDKPRWEAYFRRLEIESRGSDAPASGYINGSTALFEQIASVDAVFNRMIVYRRNSLHSACIDDNHVPPPDPLEGRLSINTFIDVG